MFKASKKFSLKISKKYISKSTFSNQSEYAKRSLENKEKDLKPPTICLGMQFVTTKWLNKKERN